MNLATVVHDHALRRGEAPALGDRERTLTYAQLWRRSGAVAARLRGCGVEAGDAVAVAARNCVELPILYLATMRLGAVFAPLNPRLTTAEGRQLVEMLAPALRVAERDCLELVGDPALELGEFVGLGAAEPAAGLAGRPYPARPDEVDHVLFTSGTSALPKGAALTHGNVLASCANVVLHRRITATDRHTIVLPMCHTAALHAQLTPAWYAGAEVHALSRWDVEEVARELHDHPRATSFLLVEQWADVVAELAGSSLPARPLVTGGAPVPQQLIDEVEQIFGAPLGLTMGMTEVMPQICFLAPEQIAGRGGSIGRPTAWADVRLVDDDGAEPRDGEPGELRVRGPLVMARYWNRPDATADAFDADGWFRSGDLAVRDADGFLSIVDRIKDVVRSGGENVYCAEVERVLIEHPAVAEVAVVGTPHPRWGEGVTAVVVCEAGTTLTLAEAQRACAGRLASYKKPVALHLVSALPRNSTGKVLKRVVRERLNELERRGDILAETT